MLACAFCCFRSFVLLRADLLVCHVDIKKAIYEVDDLSSALSNTAQTQIKEVGLLAQLLFIT